MYVLDYHRQISLMQEMTQLRKDDESWEVYYHHPSTNEMWKSYFPKANGIKRGPKILRTEPVPEELEDRLTLCLTSDDKDDAIGLGIELSVKPSLWRSTIVEIEESFREYDRNQLKLFFENIGIFEYEALFEELHITPQQFDLDEKSLGQLKWKARKILFKKFWIFW